MSMVSGNNGAVSQINVTPLIDVLLVLLIIFMVIVPAKPNGLPVVAPQPSKGGDVSPATIVVQVLLSGGTPSYRINSTGFAKAELEPKLAEIFAAREQKVMFLKGDPGLTFDEVAEVVNFGRQAGAKEVAVLTPMSEVGR